MKIDKIIRSRRKTIAIHITEKVEVEVRAPLNFTDETIHKFVEKHKKWIENTKEKIRRRNESFQPKKFLAGEQFLYLGKNYSLSILETNAFALRFENGFFLAEKHRKSAKQLFIALYKQMAHRIISQRTADFAQRLGLKYRKISITKAEKRWGSCSTKRNLNFSWRLILAPLPIVDYVIIHELIHLIEHNHSANFWKLVGKALPDFKERQLWLKENGFKLNI